jgi:histidinol dehydrogenase
MSAEPRAGAARRFRHDDPGFATAFRAFLDERRGAPAEVDAAVAAVIEEVRSGGVDALLACARRFDRVDMTEGDLRVAPEEIEAGWRACPAEVRDALGFAADRIRRYHERQRPADARWTDEAGVELGWRWTALDSVGVYVPGGRAAYPSSVLMNAVPAQVAGVERVAMATPPGRLEPAVLAAAHVAGVTEIWRVGGAQACAALAYGAGPIAPVDKIVGPGNAYVSAAKRRLYGVVGIDALAGPSEILVVADADNDPDWIAADLLSQAEHDPDAQAVLITPDAGFADQVERAVERQLDRLASAEVARASWVRHGAVVVAPLEATPPLVDALAPEHAEFAVADPQALADRVRHAGAIFLGRWTPEAVGDYVAGSNHVLPTSRAARFSSGLSVYDFLKRTSLLRCTPESFARLGPATVALADAEGLPAHARAAALRLGQRPPGPA